MGNTIVKCRLNGTEAKVEAGEHGTMVEISEGGEYLYGVLAEAVDSLANATHRRIAGSAVDMWRQEVVT